MNLFLPLISALGAFGALSVGTAYFGGSSLLLSLSAFILTLALTAAGGKQDKSHQLRLVFGLFLLAFLGLFFFRDTLSESFLASAGALAETLRAPYGLTMAVPKAAPGTSGTPFAFFLVYLTACFFTAAHFFFPGKIIQACLLTVLLFLGFYYGTDVPVYGTVLLGAYLLTIPAGLHKSVQSFPEVPVFLFALAAGAVLSLIVPEDRYEQPGFLSRMQDAIVASTAPYDPVFHAGNAYTGLMKGTPGSDALGSVRGIRYSGRILADIESAETDRRLYLRSWTGGAYRLNRWNDLPDSDYDSVSSLFRKTQGEWYDQGAWLMEVISRSPALSQTLSNYTKNGETPAVMKRDFSVDAVYEKTKYFLLPYDASFGTDFFVFDRAPVSAGGKAYSTYRWDLPAGALLSMMARESSADPYYTTYMRSEESYRNFVYARYLDVPDSVKEALSALGPLPKVSTLSEKRRRVEEIRAFLARNYRYTVNPGKTPPGEDFISYFLLHSKKGYCTSFASAAVMLLRESGIPARYAVGLTVGPEELNSSALSPSGLRLFSVNDRHAHAWAEVYVDGLGWQPVEMTPGYDGTPNPLPLPEDKKKNDSGAPDAPRADRENRRDNPEQPSSENKKQTKTPPPQQQQPQQNPPQQSRPQNGSTFSFAAELLAFLLVLLAGAAGVLFFRWTAADRLIARASSDKMHFNRLIDYGDRLSVWAQLPVRGPLSARREAARKDVRFAPLADFLALLEKARFSGKGLSPEARKHGAALIRTVRERCLSGMTFREKLDFRIRRKL